MERMILALAAVVALQMVGLIVVAVVLLRPTFRVKIDHLHVGDVNGRTNETAAHPTLEQLQYGGREVDRMLMAKIAESNRWCEKQKREIDLAMQRLKMEIWEDMPKMPQMPF